MLFHIFTENYYFLTFSHLNFYNQANPMTILPPLDNKNHPSNPFALSTHRQPFTLAAAHLDGPERLRGKSPNGEKNFYLLLISLVTK